MGSNPTSSATIRKEGLNDLLHEASLKVERDLKAAGKEKFAKLFGLPRRGREHLDFYEQSEVKSLVIRDQIPPPPLDET